MKVLSEKQNLAPNCPCPKKDCVRHSDCEKCVKHHEKKDEMPFCAR